MDLRVVAEDVTATDVDALIVNLFEGVLDPGGATGAIDNALGGGIKGLIEAGELKGKLGELVLIHTLGRIPARRVLVAGLGKQEHFNLDKTRRITGDACRFLRSRGVKTIATITHGAGTGGIAPEASAQAVSEGAVMGLYIFRRHKTRNNDLTDIEEVRIVERDPARVPSLEAGCARGRAMAEAVNFARDMINEPSNFMTPSHMAAVAAVMASEYDLECRVLEPKEMKDLGMGALLGVAQGSHQEPRFIIMTHRGDEGSDKMIGLAGKGITFDSGGISIKPSEGMGEMKGDMAGGATVMAVMRALAVLKAEVNVTALIPATENLPGGGALKPGDVLRAMNDKTVEVVNTDAEGRLILADALSYARKEGMSPVIDVATLTGSIRVALGSVATGMFANDQPLAAAALKAADEAGECVWQMPMFDEYKEQIKSDVADMKNTGGRYGGAITAALFLAEFIEDTPWMHFDIAGTAESDKEKGYVVKGATGVTVRALVNLLLSMNRK